MENYTYKADFRKREIEQRQVREGKMLLFQARTIIHEEDGSITMGIWRTTGVITNYGDVMDSKMTFFEKLRECFSIWLS